MIHVYLYLKGIVIIIGLIAYVTVFNYFYYKWFNEKLWEDNYSGIGAIIMPFLAIFVLMVVLIIPYVIGAEFLR